MKKKDTKRQLRVQINRVKNVNEPTFRMSTEEESTEKKQREQQAMKPEQWLKHYKDLFQESRQEKKAESSRR